MPATVINFDPHLEAVYKTDHKYSCDLEDFYCERDSMTRLEIRVGLELPGVKLLIKTHE